MRNTRVRRCQSCVKWSLTMSAMSAIFLYIPVTANAAEVPAGRSSYQDIETVAVPSEDEGICDTQGCNDAALRILMNMDPDVDPCDNFYKYACGGFLKSTTIPEDKTTVDTFSNIHDHLQEQLRRNIEAEITADERRPFRLVKSFYKSCMNTNAIEAKGLEPLREMLRTLGGWPVLDGDSWNDGDFDWGSSIYKLRNAGSDPNDFIDFSVSEDLKNNTKHIINLDEAYLGLSREYLTKGFDDKIVSAYYSYMVDIAVMLGANKERAIEELKKSLIFEMKLANISLPNEKRRNATQLYNPMTLAELAKTYPSVPWKEYFGLLPAPISIEENEIIIINVPKYITDLEELMGQTPKRIQANYVMWKVVQSVAKFLNDEIRKRQLAYSTVLSGHTEREARWKECVGIVSGNLPTSVGAMYVREYFNNEAKKNAIEMVIDIKEEFKRILKNVTWMDEITRQGALKKAAAMASYIAYPDELLNDDNLEKLYENLTLSDDNYLGNVLNLSSFHFDDLLNKLRKPVNKTDWVNHGYPAVVNAFYHSIENSIQFPAGILQGAFFSNDRPRYMNYGAIGAVIGHEITHGFDDQGRQFDGDGNLVDWWASTTKENFLQRAQCIIDQYGNYTAEEVGLKLNGINTQGENIADNGGFKAAYYAYKQSIKRNGPEMKLPKIARTPQQLFWMSAANVWCSKYRPETLKRRITTGFHSPAEFRIIGPFSNIEEFSKDFNCPIGSKMNPKKKCSVW